MWAEEGVPMPVSKFPTPELDPLDLPDLNTDGARRFLRDPPLSKVSIYRDGSRTENPRAAEGLDLDARARQILDRSVVTREQRCRSIS